MPLRGGGWVQGYNCQAVTTRDGVIIATGVSNNTKDSTAYLGDDGRCCRSTISPRTATWIHPDTPAGAEDQDEQIGCCSPMPATCRQTTSLPTAPTGSSPPPQSHKLPHSTGGWRTRPRRRPHREDDLPPSHRRRPQPIHTTQPHRRNPIRARQTQPEIPAVRSRGLLEPTPNSRSTPCGHNIMKTIAAGHWAT